MKEKPSSFLEKNSLVIKIIVIGFLSIILLIPMQMIRSLIMERKERQNEALKDITSIWGESQQITGPVLIVPYSVSYINDKQETRVMRNQKWFLPEDLKIEANIVPEIRKRGLFKVVVYTTVVHLEGYFNEPGFDEDKSNIEIDWERAFGIVGISELRGIKEPVRFTWNDKSKITTSGASLGSIKSGIIIPDLLDKEEREKRYHFSAEIHLNGSQNISFASTGKITRARVTSTWKNPGFAGAFLPATREVNDDGFVAEWQVLEMNRNYAQQGTNDNINFNESAFGVNLLIPVETYQVTERSMKYAILFIVLTFSLFFFIETLKKLKIHPIHYTLVGMGLILFYLLLLSLSEHIGFGPAYLVASAGIIGMISTYSGAIFRNRKITTVMVIYMTVIYSFLFVLLQLQDYALLLGSIMLFIILGIFMYFSSKIDWYRTGAEETDSTTTPDKV
jgi:inner membrane protein